MAPTGSNSMSRKTPTAPWWSHTIATSCARPERVSRCGRPRKTDLADIDIGSSFAPEFADQRVPTLRQVLELAKGRAGVFIELKYYGHDVSLEEKVVALVEETGMTDDIVIMSLSYDGVRAAAALRPDWTYGLLNAVAIGDLTRLDVDFLALTAKATDGADDSTHPPTRYEDLPVDHRRPGPDVGHDEPRSGRHHHRPGRAGQSSQGTAGKSNARRSFHHLDRRRNRLVEGDGAEFVRGGRVDPRFAARVPRRSRNQAGEDSPDMRRRVVFDPPLYSNLPE